MSPKGETIGERMKGAETWIEDHEKQCADRYLGIQKSIDRLEGGLGGVQGTLRTLSRGAFLLLLSILGWCLVQMYNGMQAAAAVNSARVAALEQRQPPVTVFQTQTPVPAKPAH